MDYTKKVTRNYWDYRSESYSNEVIENSEEERKAWKSALYNRKIKEGKWRTVTWITIFLLFFFHKIMKLSDK